MMNAHYEKGKNRHFGFLRRFVACGNVSDGYNKTILK